MAHPRAQLCHKSEVDLFLGPLVQSCVDRSQFIQFFPVSNITPGGPIEFSMSGASDEFTDLRNSFVEVSGQITRANGDPLEDDDHVGPVNLFLQALFSQIDLSLNDKLVSSATNTNPYRAMMTTLFTYGSDAKDSQLQSQLFFKDTAGSMDQVNPQAARDARNHGLATRFSYCRNSRTFELMGPLHLDLCCQDRLILNGVNIRIRMNRSKNAFCLVSSVADADYKVTITEASLHVRKVKLHNDVFLGIVTALQRTPALYHINRVECKVLSIPSGQMTFNPDDVFLGQIPKRIVIGLVENTAFNGVFNRNPFNFQHFHATQVGVYVNGESTPMKALQLNFNQSRYLKGYMSLFLGTGQLFHDKGIQIQREEYPQGYTLYAFDLTPDLSTGPHVSPIRQGNLRIGIQFAQPLPVTVNAIIYAEFDSLIEIDHNRNVTFNWGN